MRKYERADFERDGLPEQNLTFLTGWTGSLKLKATANATQHATVAL